MNLKASVTISKTVDILAIIVKTNVSDLRVIKESEYSLSII